jgi:hypothetical protein
MSDPLAITAGHNLPFQSLQVLDLPGQILNRDWQIDLGQSPSVEIYCVVL